MEYEFCDLKNASLVVDAIYLGGIKTNHSSEVLHILLPKCGVSGGFRKVNRNDNSGKTAYVVLFTTMSENEWPDFLDVETGIFRYYGDNRLPGKQILDTKLKGNKLLEEVFSILNSKGPYDDIPPFFIFRKAGKGRSVQFLGLAVPGNQRISPDRDLVSFWRTIHDKRFQNYEAYFTILDTKEVPISKDWLKALIEDNANSIKYAPTAWSKFISLGRNGIEALTSPKIIDVPTKAQQLNEKSHYSELVDIIRAYYKDKPVEFEKCAVEIIKMTDANYYDFQLTRPWRDGGRDAIGHYQLTSGGMINQPLKIDCALEAKCYSKANSVGVREMSRLISRIKYRQFGILITTSYVDTQAYKEVVEDGHPILIITAADIGRILSINGKHSDNMIDWLETLS